MSVHQFDPNSLPDSEFDSGTFKFLVEGNKCRLLDQRRTPGRIENVFESEAMFRWRIESFEDKGKYWDLPFEWVKRMQFPRDSHKNNLARENDMLKISESMEVPLIIEVNQEALRTTKAEIEQKSRSIKDWLVENSTFFDTEKSIEFNYQNGTPELANDLITYMNQVQMTEQEQLTSETYVLNPYSGKWLKGLQIVMAEMGLKRYVGKIARTKNIFDGQGDRDVRRKYLIARLAFVKAMFEQMGRRNIVLFRGMCTEGEWRSVGDRFFSSWTLSRKVAESFASFESHPTSPHAYLIKRSFPVEKVFMTCLETKAMNNQYREYEAVIIHDDQDEKIL